MSSFRPVRRLLDPLVLIPIALALVWGAIALFTRPVGDYGVETDFYGDFAVYARQWMHGEPSLMNGFRGPFYYLLIGALGLPFGDMFPVAKVLSALAAALGTGFAGALMNRLWGRRVAIAGLLFLAGNATLMEYAYRAGSDLVFFALVTAGLFLLLGGERTSARRWFAAGLVAGLAWLTRYNGVALVPGALLAAFLIEPRKGRSAALAGAFLGGWAIAVAPWSLYTWSQAGSPFWNKNYENMAIAVYTENAGRAQQGGFMSAIRFRSLAEVILVDPARFLFVMARNTATHLGDDVRRLVGWWWLPVVAAGILANLRRRPSRRTLAFFGFGAFTFATLLPAFYNPRFMIPLLPFWAAVAGGAARLPELRLPRPAKPAKPSRRPARSSGALTPERLVLGALTLLAVVATVDGVRASQDPKRQGGSPVEYLELRRQVKRLGEPIGPDTPIAARKPHIGYYLGAPVIPIPEGGVPNLRARGAHYLLVSGIEVTLYPSLHALWVVRDPNQVFPGLRLVTSVSVPTSAGNRVATLYAVNDPAPWTPKESRPLPAPDPVPDGWTRLDVLRYRLADWLLRWNGEVSPLRYLNRLSPAVAALPQTKQLLGDAELEEKELWEAKRTYSECLEADPDNPQLLLRLAGVTALLEEPEMFQQVIREFVQTQPDPDYENPAWWLNLTVPWLAARDHAACLAPTYLAASMAPNDPGPLKRFGYILIELRRKADAVEYLKRALALAPDDGEAKSLLEIAQED